MDIRPIFWQTQELKEDYVFPESLLITELIVAAFGTTANVTFIVFVLTSQPLRTSNSSAFAMSLSLADCMVCSIVMVVDALRNYGFVVGLSIMELCNVWNGFPVFACTASSYNVVAIAVDRYICIGDPQNYYSHMPRKMLYIVLAGTWIGCLMIAFFPLIIGSTLNSVRHNVKSDVCIPKPDKIYVIIVTSITVFLPCLIIIFIYSRIFILAHQHSAILKKSIQNLQNRVQTSHSATTPTKTPKTSETTLAAVPNEDPPMPEYSFNELKSAHFSTVFSSSAENFRPFDSDTTGQLQRLSAMKQLFMTRIFSSHLKATMTLTFIVFIFVIHWLPFGILKVIIVMHPGIVSGKVERGCLWLLLIHSCWNPFVFMLSSSSLRSVMVKSVLCCRKSESEEQEPEISSEHRSKMTTSVMFNNLQLSV